MQKALMFKAKDIGLTAARIVSPLTTSKPLYYGAAISCAAGLGLGLWLEPPRAHMVRPGSMTPFDIQLPQDPAPVAALSVAPRTDASYAWYTPTPAVQPAAAVQSQPQPQLIARNEPPIQLAEADPDWRDEDADERDLPPPPRWDRGDREPRWPSRDGGDRDWSRDGDGDG